MTDKRKRDNTTDIDEDGRLSKRIKTCLDDIRHHEICDEVAFSCHESCEKVKEYKAQIHSQKLLLAVMEANVHALTTKLSQLQQIATTFHTLVANQAKELQCFQCKQPWDEVDHRPVQLLPCLHLVCHACHSGMMSGTMQTCPLSDCKKPSLSILTSPSITSALNLCVKNGQVELALMDRFAFTRTHLWNG